MCSVAACKARQQLEAAPQWQLAHRPLAPPGTHPPLVWRAGILAQHNAQPGSPLEQLGKHLENPWANHFINK